MVEAILGDSQRDESLELVAHRARELAGADLAAIFVVRGDELVLAASSLDGELQRSARLPMEGSLLGQVARSGKPMHYAWVESLDKASRRRISSGASAGRHHR